MALSKDRATPYTDGVEIAIPVYRNVKIYAGSLVCVGSHGFAIPGADASGNVLMGVALEQADNTGGNDGDIKVRVRRKGVFEFAATSITQAMVGDLMYVVDDQTFDETSPGNNVVAGILVKYISATKGWLAIDAGTRVGTAIAGTAISVADSGEYFAGNNVEAVLAEVGAELAILNKGVVMPFALLLEDGTALTKFSSAPTPGYVQLNNKEVVLQWAKHATPSPISALFLLPDDLDSTAPVRVHFLAAMGGATDTPEMTMEAYFNKGDTDCAGADDEIDGGVTLTEYSMTIAHGDVPDAGPAALTVVANPKDGELGTDACYLYAIWAEYTKKKAA